MKRNNDLCSDFEKLASEHYFEMSDGVKVRILKFDLAEKPNETILFFIPGFVTVFQSWEKVLKPLSKEFQILYFESREKASSIMPNRKTERQITLQKMAHDIKEVIEQLELDKKSYVTVCSSTGGTIEVEALSKKWLNPKGAVMVGPTMEYNMKFIATFMVSVVPEFVKRLFFPFFKWFMGAVYVNKKEHPEQYAKYIRAGKEAKMRKIRRVLWQMRHYQCWEMVPKIDTYCLLVGASEDKMHRTEATKRVYELLPNAKFIDLGTNEAAHDMPLVEEIKKFVQEINKKS